jgi:hypothetical protein
VHSERCQIFLADFSFSHSHNPSQGGRASVGEPRVCIGVDVPIESGDLSGVNLVGSNSNVCKTEAGSRASTKGEAGPLQGRLTAKAHWKAQPGHRYTPEELQRMSEAADVTIQRRKRVVMQI